MCVYACVCANFFINFLVSGKSCSRAGGRSRALVRGEEDPINKRSPLTTLRRAVKEQSII